MPNAIVFKYLCGMFERNVPRKFWCPRYEYKLYVKRIEIRTQMTFHYQKPSRKMDLFMCILLFIRVEYS